jgi:hypothetical protein
MVPHRPYNKSLQPTELPRILSRLVSRLRGSVSSFIRRVSRSAAEIPPFSGRSLRSHPLNGARDAIEQFLWRPLAMLAPPNCSMERNPLAPLAAPLRSAPLPRGCAFGAPPLGGSAHLAPHWAAEDKQLIQRRLMFSVRSSCSLKSTPPGD